MSEASTRATLASTATLVASLVLALSGSAETTDTTARGITSGQARAWEPHVRAAREYADSRAGHVGFAVLDMRGRLHHSGGGGQARMASTFKVMLMVAYLRRNSVEHRALHPWEKDLIRPMIRKSDNEAATRIRDMLGRAPIERLADRVGMKHFEWHDIWGHCKTSARDQALFMRTLHRHVPARHWSFAKRQLGNIVARQRWGIARAKPAGWRLYFKGGWGSGSGAVDHQVAFLTNEGRRIGVAILTEDNPSHDYGKRTLEGVARRLLRGLPR